MPPLILRARAICRECDSRLPPRSEAFVDEATGDVFCPSCAAFIIEHQIDDPSPVGAEEVDHVEPAEIPLPPAPPLVARRAVASPAPEVPGADDPEAPSSTPPAPSEPAAGTFPATGRRALPERDDPDAPGRPARRFDRATAPVRTPSTGRLEQRSFVADGTAAVAPDARTHAPSPSPRPRLVEAPRPEEGGDHGAEAVGLFGRIRRTGGASDGELPAAGDGMVVERPSDPTVGGRGDHRGSPIGTTLEAARIHGIEVLHGYGFDPATSFDHVVVGTNGVWVIRSAPAASAPLEKRDVGDWFTSDPRLHIGDDDRTDLIELARSDADSIRAIVASSPHADVPVRPVLCFPENPPRSEGGPMTVASVLVTWRNRLAETLVDPVLLSAEDRAELVEFLQIVRFRTATDPA